MMKRSTPGGSSPAFKCSLSDKLSQRLSVDTGAAFLSKSQHGDGGITNKLLGFKPSLNKSGPISPKIPSFPLLHDSHETADDSFDDALTHMNEPADNSSQELLSKLVSSKVQPQDLAISLEHSMDIKGVSATASMLLQNEDLKREITRQLCKEAHDEFKTSLTSSHLTKLGRDRDYLLSLTPKLICEEFHKNSLLSFSLLTEGLFGTSADKVRFHILKQ